MGKSCPLIGIGIRYGFKYVISSHGLPISRQIAISFQDETFSGQTSWLEIKPNDHASPHRHGNHHQNRTEHGFRDGC